MLQLACAPAQDQAPVQILQEINQALFDPNPQGSQFSGQQAQPATPLWTQIQPKIYKGLNEELKQLISQSL